jgi:GNAT superfamily N-acetyltransferase
MLFLAVKDGRTVGRISAHTNTQHNKEHNDNIGFFGFFESEDDQEVADALFAAAYEWNRYRGKTAMRGPMNFSVNEECGLLIDGFDSPPMVMMRHDKPYYQRLYENHGLVKVMDLYAYLAENKEMPPRVEKAAQLISRRANVDIRSLSKNKKQLRKDIETVFQIYTKAWEYNWGAVPMTDAEFDAIVDELLPLADPELVFIAEVDGKPAGFSLALPNYNEVLHVMRGRINPITLVKALIAKKKIRSARVITMGVIKEYQGRGIDTLFYYHQYKNGLPKKLFRGEFSWVLENNTMMIRAAEMLGGRIYKTYRLYDQEITAAN